MQRTPQLVFIAVALALIPLALPSLAAQTPQASAPPRHFESAAIVGHEESQAFSPD